MSGRLSMKEERVKKGEVIKLHPLPPEVRTELDRSEQEEQVAKIRAIHLDKKPEPKGSLVGNATTMRERILALSLFPNIYNKHYLERNE